MPEIFPFRGYRYHLNNAQTAQAVSPPYDVINADQERNLRKIDANAIHIELPLGESLEKYENAKKIWDVILGSFLQPRR